MDNTSSYCAAASTVREAGRCLAKHTKFRKVGKVYQAKNYLKYIIPVIIVMLIVNFPKEGFWSTACTVKMKEKIEDDAADSSGIQYRMIWI